MQKKKIDIFNRGGWIFSWKSLSYDAIERYHGDAQSGLRGRISLLVLLFFTYRLTNAKSLGGLPKTEMTLPEYLKNEGYTTFAIGKWHLGHLDTYHPNDRGFDHYLGVPYSLDMGCLDYTGYSHPSQPSCSSDTQHYPAVPLYKNKTIIEQPLNLRNLSDIYFNEFKERLEAVAASQTKNSSNFFGYVPFSKVHVPLGVSKQFQNLTDSIYGDNLMELDHNFGRMIQVVKDLGLFEDTIIWLASDNGPWEKECQFGGSYIFIYIKLIYFDPL